MTDFSPLTDMCVVRPRWKLMQRAYDDYATDRRPCRTTIEGNPVENQCAVRMSIALERCGFDLAGFGRLRDHNDPRRIHRGRATCQVDVPHVLAADELHRFLDATLGFSDDYRGRQLAGAKAALQGRFGIIYFNNCFQRSGQVGRRGDHIDLWDGAETYNQKQGGSTGPEGTDARMFSNADRIRFVPLL
jgi:Type VI secretion system (T6SS), amidase effector protein 4